jgi:hypothetical protein
MNKASHCHLGPPRSFDFSSILKTLGSWVKDKIGQSG